MKLLFVNGGDNSASFIEDEVGVKNAVKLAENKGGSCIIEDNENYAKVTIIEFGEVDIKFIKFINDNFIDYDFSKDSNFFIVEE